MNYRHPAAATARISFVRDADTGGAGGNPTAVATPARASVPEVYSSDFVRGLLSERDALKNAATATEAKAAEARAAAEKAADDARAASEKAVKDAEGAVTKAAKAFSDRLVRAEVKAGAMAAGLAHLDFLKLIDTSEVKVSEDGDVTVPEGFWAGVKTKLPHLFQATGADKGTTSQTKSAPKPADPNAKKAGDMTPAEFKAAMSRIARGENG